MDDAKFTSIHKKFHFHTTILPWLKFLVDGSEFLVDGSAWKYPFQTRWLYFNQNFFNTLLPGVFTVTSIQSKIISTIYIYCIYISLPWKRWKVPWFKPGQAMRFLPKEGNGVLPPSATEKG